MKVEVIIHYTRPDSRVVEIEVPDDLLIEDGYELNEYILDNAPISWDAYPNDWEFV